MRVLTGFAKKTFRGFDRCFEGFLKGGVEGFFWKGIY